jgi:molecular chaperone DnaJ
MHNAQKDYYEILGVPEDAAQDEIRTAYLALAKQYHPDKTGGDKSAEEKLKAINEAYDVLKRPEKRKEYDEARQNPFETASGFSGFGGQSWQTSDASFEDLFGDIFGRRAGGGSRTGRTRGPRRGNNVEVEVSVPFQDIVRGASRTISVPLTAPCEACGGSGAAPGGTVVQCPDCAGSGMVTEESGGYFFQRTCGRCGGTGSTQSQPCPTCGGNGRVRSTKTLNVKIPAGADTGTRLRLAGQGDAGEQGAPAGDLFVVVRVQDDPVFRRDGLNVMTEMKVPFVDLALGTTIRVATPTGAADLKIPAGTQSGKVFRLTGQGLPSVDGRKKGALLVEVNGLTPQALTPEQADLLRRLKESLPADAGTRQSDSSAHSSP